MHIPAEYCPSCGETHHPMQPGGLCARCRTHRAAMLDQVITAPDAVHTTDAPTRDTRTVIAARLADIFDAAELAQLRKDCIGLIDVDDDEQSVELAELADALWLAARVDQEEAAAAWRLALRLDRALDAAHLAALAAAQGPCAVIDAHASVVRRLGDAVVAATDRAVRLDRLAAGEASQ